jgi:putative hydrolase of the HAD superfamily
MQNKIEHIFLDLDHTIWDFETNSDAAYRKLLAEFNIPVSFEDFIEVYHPINQRIWEDYSAGKYSKEQVKIIRLKATLDTLGYELPPGEVLQMADRYLDFLAEGTVLFPGAKETLEYLAGKYPLHLITNGFKEVQYRKIENSGLNRYFQTVTVSEETGELKPHPSVFRYALEKAGTVAHKSAMVGDSLKSDVLGALNVGMSAVLFDPKGMENLPRTVAPTVKCLTELKDLF